MNSKTVLQAREQSIVNDAEQRASAVQRGLIFIAAIGVIFLSFVGLLVLWNLPAALLTPLYRTLRLGLPFTLLAGIMALVWSRRRHDLAPDFLRQLIGKPFECDGVCFYVTSAATNGVAYLNVTFQNQYDSPCNFRVVATPPVATLRVTKRIFDPVSLEFPVEGGAFGVARVPVGIPAKFRGKKIDFNLAAATTREFGIGTQLRFHGGTSVEKLNASALASVALTIGISLLVGPLHYHRWRASVTVRLPREVAETPPMNAETEFRTLWKPGDTVEGLGVKFRQALEGFESQPLAYKPAA